MYEYLAEDVRDKHPYTMYDLVANIVHDGQPGKGKGTYRIQVLYKVRLQFFLLTEYSCFHVAS